MLCVAKKLLLCMNLDSHPFPEAAAFRTIGTISEHLPHIRIIKTNHTMESWSVYFHEKAPLARFRMPWQQHVRKLITGRFTSLYPACCISYHINMNCGRAMTVHT